jgi:hypothetical protein
MPSNNSGSIPNEAPTLHLIFKKAYEAALQFLISYSQANHLHYDAILFVADGPLLKPIQLHQDI